MTGQSSFAPAESYLKTLDGLHELIDKRQEAHANGESFRELILLGRFILDRSGRIWRCKFSHAKSFVDWLEDELPAVEHGEFLTQILPGVHVDRISMWLPRSSDVCRECGESWTIDNCHDVSTYAVDVPDSISGKRTKVFLHPLCSKIERQRLGMRRHAETAAKAGLGAMVLVPTKNEYYTDEDVSYPWCVMRTPKGEIKFGPRKRVAHVEWGDIVRHLVKGFGRGATVEQVAAFEASLGASALFPSEDVTKGDFYIHAWSEEKLVEYMRKIAKTVQIGEFKKGAEAHE